MNTSIYSQYDIEGYFEKAPSYEVGQPGTVTFNLTSPIDSITSMTEITWSYRLTYDGHCEQVYGYIGENDCFSFYSVPNPSIRNSYTLNLQPTDRAPEEIILELLFIYDAINGTSYTIRKEERLKINTIRTPTIFGSNSVQECCQNLLQYEAVDFGKANTFNWNVTGGAEIVEEDGNMITVKPSKNNNYTVNCEVKRAEAHPSYSKTRSLKVDRHAPTTSEIEGPPFICEGDTVNFSIDWEKICNAYGVE